LNIGRQTVNLDVNVRLDMDSAIFRLPDSGAFTNADTDTWPRSEYSIGLR
jgi:hypothetical protein